MVYCSRMIKFYYITSLLLLLLFLTIFKGVKPESDSTPALLLSSHCPRVPSSEPLNLSGSHLRVSAEKILLLC